MWVRYSDIRNKIQTGDVFFTASPALFSRLIRFFTRSTVSHCGVFIQVGSRMFVVESLEKHGVIMSLASTRFDTTKIIVARPNSVPTVFEENVLSSVQATGYDLVGALLSPFFDTKSKQKFCSEFVMFTLQKELTHFKSGVTPRDLLTVLSDNIIK